MESENYTFKYSPAILLWWAAAGIYFYSIAEIQSVFPLKILFESLAALSVLIILFILIYKPKIYEDYDTLYLSFLFFKKEINYRNVEWYSTYVPDYTGIFCHSRYNLCLLSKGKKFFFSVKEVEKIESRLLYFGAKYHSSKDDRKLLPKNKRFKILDFLSALTTSVIVYLVPEIETKIPAFLFTACRIVLLYLLIHKISMFFFSKNKFPV